jgi:hypothetical protein
MDWDDKGKYRSLRYAGHDCTGEHKGRELGRAEGGSLDALARRLSRPAALRRFLRLALPILRRGLCDPGACGDDCRCDEMRRWLGANAANLPRSEAE